MFKTGRHLITVAVFGLAAAFMALRFGSYEVSKLKTRIGELEEERTRLVEYAQRLTASRRVAQVDILDQQKLGPGRFSTMLRWQEMTEDGRLGAPQTVEVFGSSVYFEALVIKFEHRHVGAGDSGRDASMAMFRRIFGDQQEPMTGYPLPQDANPLAESAMKSDPLGSILWARFWDFIDDPKTCEEYGVRVAQIEAPSVPVKPGQSWQIRIDAAGGLNIRKIADRPVAPETPRIGAVTPSF